MALLTCFGCLSIKSLAEENYQTTKSQLLKHFNEKPEIRELQDLLEEEYRHKGRPVYPTGFSPVLLKLKLPYAVQSLNRDMYPSLAQRIEEFYIVYDGCLLFIAAEIELSRPWSTMSFPDARDKFNEIVKAIYETVVVPPTVSHIPILFLSEEEKKTTSPSPRMVITDRLGDARETLATFYDYFNDDIDDFYNVCSGVDDLSELNDDIQKLGNKLTESLRAYHEKPWYSFNEKRKIIGSIEKTIVNMLCKLQEHGEVTAGLKATYRDFAHGLEDEPFFGEIMGKIEWKDYAEPQSLDTESVIRMMEHARAVTETALTSTTSILSAIIGAVLGSLLTLLITILLKV